MKSGVILFVNEYHTVDGMCRPSTIRDGIKKHTQDKNMSALHFIVQV